MITKVIYRYLTFRVSISRVIDSDSMFGTLTFSHQVNGRLSPAAHVSLVQSHPKQKNTSLSDKRDPFELNVSSTCRKVLVGYFKTTFEPQTQLKQPGHQAHVQHANVLTAPLKDSSGVKLRLIKEFPGGIFKTRVTN